jgi:hypothetical protein
MHQRTSYMPTSNSLDYRFRSILLSVDCFDIETNNKYILTLNIISLQNRSIEDMHAHPLYRSPLSCIL